MHGAIHTHASRRASTRRRVGALAAVAALMLTACGGETTPPDATPESPSTPSPGQPPDGTGDDWDAIVAAAQEEGTVIWYTAMLANIATPYIAEFQAAYPGIRVEMIQDTGQGIIERFENEARAGVDTVDVVLTSVPQAAIRWKEQNWLAPVDLPEAEAMEAEHQDPDGTWYFHYITGYSLQYNTNAVTVDELPETWDDLFDAHWAGRIGMSPPWRSGVGAAWAMWLDEELGIQDAAERFAALDPHLASAPGDLNDAVIRGEVDIAPQLDYVAYEQIANGAPVGLHFPSDGLPVTPRVTGVAANAPNPNAAQVFLNWQLSKEANDYLMQNHYFGSVRDDVTDFPAVMVDYTDLPTYFPDITRPISDQDVYVQEWERQLTR